MTNGEREMKRTGLLRSAMRLGMLAVAGSAGAGGSVAFDQQEFEGPDPTYMSYLAEDIDGDGRVDVLARLNYNYGAAEYSWLKNEGNMAAANPRTIGVFPSPAGVGASTMAMADMDGDGDRDIFDRYLWLERDGEVFRHRWISDVSSPAVPYDADGDGDMDVISSRSLDVTWRRNDGDRFVLRTMGLGEFQFLLPQAIALGRARPSLVGWRHFGNPAQVSTTLYAMDIDQRRDPEASFRVLGNAIGIDGYNVFAAEDIDNDGDDDFLASYRVVSGNAPSVIWIENRGADAAEAHAITSSADALYFAVGDLNGDSLTDLVASTQDFKTAWYENPGGTGPWPEHNLTSLSNQWRGPLLVFDANGDGRADIFSPSGRLWLNLGTFTPAQPTPSPTPTPTPIPPEACADTNGDGHVDAADVIDALLLLPRGL